MQFGAYLTREEIATFADVNFRDGNVVDFGIPEEEMLRFVEKGAAFRTTGCPDYNRPYATETRLGVFNFSRSPDEREIEAIKRQIPGCGGGGGAILIWHRKDWRTAFCQIENETSTICKPIFWNRTNLALRYATSQYS